MKQHSFLTRLQRIAGLALASSAGVTALACSDEPAATSTSSSSSSSSSSSGAVAIGDGGVFTDDGYACGNLGEVVSGLTPATAVDYLEVRRQAMGGDGGGAKRAASKTGTPCATAKDKAACMAALDALGASTRDEGWGTTGDPIGPLVWDGSQEVELVVYTRGDEVKALRTTADLKAFLGTVDNLEEARLLLQTMNVQFACTSTPAKSGWKQNPDGSFELLVAGIGCGTFVKYRWHYKIAKDGTITGPDKDSQFESGAVCGRRPEGLASLASGASVGLAAYFAEVAHLEAASVVAFRRLEQDLRALEAPLELVTRARRSRSDEIRHARETSELARRFGAIVPPVVVEEPGPRDAFAVALENAVEGCVRETYGAAVALFQAERATPELRPILQRIANDEARHAELAHDVASWLEGRLDANERADLAKARTVAFAELAFALAMEPAADVQRVAGMPNAREAALLLAALAEDLAV